MSTFSMPKVLILAFLFIYIGLITIPGGWVGWTTPFLLWGLLFFIMAVMIIAVGIWGIIGLLISKINQTQFNPKHKFFVALIVFFIAWSFISSQIAQANYVAYENLPFNSKVWKTIQSQHTGVFSRLSPRQRMINDLTRNVLPNLTKREVEDLLGFEERSEILMGSETLLYVIGPEKGLGVDSECLLVVFDKGGHFKEYDTWPICG